MEQVKEAVEGVKKLAVQGKPAEGKQQQQKKAPKKKGAADAEDAGPLELNPRPAYIEHRIKLFEKLKSEYDQEVAEKAKAKESINITLPDGKTQTGEAWVTKPGDVARNISNSLYKRTVISKVNGELWDLERPLEGSCNIELLDFEDPEGKKVFWHSSAHVLGEAAELRFGCDLCIGPPVDDGFYYEMALPNGAAVESSDHKPLDTLAGKIIKEAQPFERLELSKDHLLEMFKSNKYKQHIIKDKIPDGTRTTVYRCGPLIDLCRGPHVPTTARIGAFQVMKNSASYFLGDAANDSLQRIYGVSFPDQKKMKEHLDYLKLAAERDHRKIGQEQELFFFSEKAPGCAFWLPHGTIIYNTLQTFLREEYWKRGYQEVISPNMFNSELWKQSGHWQHYQEDMFTFSVEKQDWGLKPMNCPGHALIFGHRTRSYNELPIRMADFGVLHRNEASGALTGLTRVRRFQQDDTHIFCTQDQITAEIAGLFDFLRVVYGRFGFSFKMKLSTRPEKYLGDIATWELAEARLTQALDEFTAAGGAKWELNEGDGAFYGPKIDITISDALRREFQCATIQLDFQLPQQFNLEYMTPDAAHAKAKDEPAAAADTKSTDATPPPPPGANEAKADAKADATAKKEAIAAVRKPLSPGCARPVMIHRAIYGSFERFIAILTEHFGGKWPFWLSPRQVLVVPVMKEANDYVLECQKVLREQGFHADVDVSGNTMQWKIRTGQALKYNFIFVVGAQERDSRTVNIRNRDDQGTQQRGEVVPLDEVIQKMISLRQTRAIENKL